MTVAHCIICERSEKWAAALRRPLKLVGHRVVETRSLDDCWAEVAARPASLVAVEATTVNLETLVAWMQRLTATFPRVRVVVLSQRGLESAQWLLREVGAVHVVCSPRHWQPVVRIAQRHLGSAPRPDDTDRQRIWRRLPWADGADGAGGT
jgi:DNA-binding response OmpR family regulator